MMFAMFVIVLAVTLIVAAIVTVALIGFLSVTGIAVGCLATLIILAIARRRKHDRP
jgi:hypothetical protein